MASAKRWRRAYNVGLGADLPAGYRGIALGHGVRGRSPPEAETLSFCKFNGSGKSAHFSEIWKQKTTDICDVSPRVPSHNLA